MTTHLTVPAPEPPRTLVIMVASEDLPIRSNSTPFSLIVAVEGAQAVKVHANSSVFTPTPLCAVVHTVIVIISAIQTPIRPYLVPPRTRPSLVHAKTVQMSANSAILPGPEPTRSPVVMVAAPQVPV